MKNLTKRKKKDPVESSEVVQVERGNELELRRLNLIRYLRRQDFEDQLCLFPDYNHAPVVAKLWHIHLPIFSCWQPHGEWMSSVSAVFASCEAKVSFIIKHLFSVCRV